MKRLLLVVAVPLGGLWLARNPGAAVVLLALIGAVVVVVRRRAWRRYVVDGCSWPGSWHACKREQCRRPIANTSRAKFCSSDCRRLARLEREAPWSDRAASRLERLNRRIAEAETAPAGGDEIPF